MLYELFLIKTAIKRKRHKIVPVTVFSSLFTCICMYVCMYFWLWWVYNAMHGLSVVAEHRLLIVEASAVADHGFYSAQESVVTAYGLGSCGSWTQLPQGMWDILQPRIKPVFPALQGGFLTTGLPGKPLSLSFNTSEFTSPLASTLPSIYWVGQKVFVHLGFSEYPNKLFGLFNKSTECHISCKWAHIEDIFYFRHACLGR